METSILKHRFHLGEIDARGTGRRVNEVTIDLMLTKCGGYPTFTMNRDGTRNYTGRKTPEYTELSICADVWNSAHTDSVLGGQCLDQIAWHRKQMTPANRKTFDRLYRLWADWHLNGLHAGTPEQEAAVKEWEAAGNRYDYDKVCAMLKERGLYEIPFTGKTVGREYKNELYQYGHGWVVVDLPEEVLDECAALVAQDWERRIEMESDIKYILVVTHGGKPIIVTNSDLKQMQRYLVQEKQICSAFHILNAQRYVISAAGTVNVTDVRIDCDEGGLRIYNKYDCLIDSYHLPEPTEPKEQEFYVRREETWRNVKRVRAKSAEEAIAKVEQDVADGAWDVLDGWLGNCDTRIVDN